MPKMFRNQNLQLWRSYVLYMYHLPYLAHVRKRPRRFVVEICAQEHFKLYILEESVSQTKVIYVFRLYYGGRVPRSGFSDWLAQ
jgi:hypothetical protein